MKNVVEDYMVEAFAEHELTEVATGDDVRVFRMQKPGTYVYCVEIIFAARRIILSGDITAGSNNGCISNSGYGIGWFSRPQGPEYLCQKFDIPRQWEEERCVAFLKDVISDAGWGYSDQQVASLKEVIDDIEGVGLSEHEVYERLGEICQGLVDDGIPGYGYSTRDMGWLAAIQQKFAELFAAKFAVTK